MGKVIKKCLACGTLNQYDAKTCKKCDCPLLADVDQEDEILGIDPMEAALDDAVTEAKEDDVVAKILREQAENAKKIVAKEKEIEERRQKRLSGSGSSRFGVPSEGSGSSFGFSLGGSGRSVDPQRSQPSRQTAAAKGGSGSFGGFRISSNEYQGREEQAPGQVRLGGGSLRMQAIKQNQSGRGGETPDKE